MNFDGLNMYCVCLPIVFCAFWAKVQKATWRPGYDLTYRYGKVSFSCYFQTSWFRHLRWAVTLIRSQRYECWMAYLWNSHPVENKTIGGIKNQYVWWKNKKPILQSSVLSFVSATFQFQLLSSIALFPDTNTLVWIMIDYVTTFSKLVSRCDS